MLLQNNIRGVFCGISAALLASCSASDEAPLGSRVESPANIASSTSSQPSPSNPPSASSSTLTVHPGPPYPTGTPDLGPGPPYRKPKDYTGPWPPPPSEWWGLPLTPMEKIIADTCPSQVWSRYVPDIDCTKDSECGDGFCDRGHCNALWTCRRRAGLPCTLDEHCPEMLCIDGRCRSCISDEECQKKYEGNRAFICGPPSGPPSHRMCGMTPPRIH